METKVREIQPMASDSWVKYEQNLQNNHLIQPVAGGEPGVKPKLEAYRKTVHEERKSPSDSKQLKTLVSEVQSCMEDLNTEIEVTVHEETGELVVKVLNRQTGDIIRQIPAEELIKLHKKLKELQGVLLDEKA
ncbi:MAG: flagellar protein FlaG [Syntrophobacteraceae bacterium]